MNENIQLLLAHLDEATFARELVELLQDKEPAIWSDTIREALRNRVASEVTRIRDAKDSVD